MKIPTLLVLVISIMIFSVTAVADPDPNDVVQVTWRSAQFLISALEQSGFPLQKTDPEGLSFGAIVNLNRILCTATYVQDSQKGTVLKDKPVCTLTQSVSGPGKSVVEDPAMEIYRSLLDLQMITRQTFDENKKVDHVTVEAQGISCQHALIYLYDLPEYLCFLGRVHPALP